MVIKKYSMRKQNANTKKYKKDNISLTNASDSQSFDIESSMIELNDNSIILYNTIQSMWNDYQSHLPSFPCLDILATLAVEESNEKIFK